MSEQLEQRVNRLETEVSSLKNQLNQLTSSTPWWEKVSGTFANNSVYDEAMQMGKEYRESLKTNLDQLSES